MGRRMPTEAFPKSSAITKTGINPTPANPAFEAPTHQAAKTSNAHCVEVKSMRSGCGGWGREWQGRYDPASPK